VIFWYVERVLSTQEIVMQTYTHFAAGLAIARVLFRGPSARLACAIASVAPDLSMIPQYIADVRAGRKPMRRESPCTMWLKEVGHSIPLWGTVTLASLAPIPFRSFVFAAGIGGLSHAFIDLLTHGRGPEEERQPYWKTATKFMWPTKIDLRRWGIWEYRYDHGVLRPKPLEAALLIGLLILAESRR
jgi:hypothetical protein